MLGINILSIPHGTMIVSDGSTWACWPEPSSHELYGEYFEKYGEGIFDHIANHYIQKYCPHIDVRHDKPVNGLKTEVEQYYLIIDWDYLKDFIVKDDEDDEDEDELKRLAKLKLVSRISYID